MAGWGSYHAFKEKDCVVCGTKFQPKSGVNKFCSAKCKGKWKYITGSGNTDAQYNKISGNWKRYFQRLCCRSHKRTELKYTDLIALLEKQNGRCAISGIELTCNLEKGKKFKTNASIDRIVAGVDGGEYVKENIQLVCAALNSWRGDTDLQEFIWFCKQIASWQEIKEQSYDQKS